VFRSAKRESPLPTATCTSGEFSWNEGKITTRGDFAGVPVASAARLAGMPLPFASTLKAGGQWSLAATPRLNGTVKLQREDGDIWLRGDGAADPKGIALGITSIELNARFSDDAVDATATLRSTRGGSADAKLAIGAVANAPLGHIAKNAPLTLAVNADLTTLQMLQPWIGTTAVVDGRARANIAARGTVNNVSLTGTVNAESLRIDAPQYGVHFHDGRLVAHFREGDLVLDEMLLFTGTGQFRAAGIIATKGRADIAPAARLTWHADNFRLFNRPDLRLTVDGDGTVTTGQGKLTLAGKLKANEGRIVYVSDTSATLGDDVVVKGWKRPSKPTLRAADLPLNVDLELDLGDKLTFSGEGLDAGLQGVVRVTTASAGGFNGKGSIRAVNGTYFAFGQKLVIDRGQLIFDGPLDNPALDIVALRKNLAVEAGVAVTGTIKVPLIQLTSNPPVPDGEKLSWLVTGQGLDRNASGADIAALQAASAVLLGRNSKPMTTTIAQSIGLDDISIKSASSAARSPRGTSDASGQVVAVGKRLSDKLSLIYEQGLTVASNALRLEYSVSRTLTLRAEAGTVSGIGIFYRKTFD
jgi:translocation and assembly module TamB